MEGAPDRHKQPKGEVPGHFFTALRQTSSVWLTPM